MAKPSPKRGKNRDNARRAKKRVSVLTEERIEYVDYKDVNLLRRFISDRAKIRARRVTGNSTQQQAEVARAIKNAREMALIPYATRVTTQRGANRDRGARADGPPPRPSGPPPGSDDAADPSYDEMDETTFEDTGDMAVGETTVETTEEAQA